MLKNSVRGRHNRKPLPPSLAPDVVVPSRRLQGKCRCAIVRVQFIQFLFKFISNLFKNYSNSFQFFSILFKWTHVCTHACTHVCTHVFIYFYICAYAFRLQRLCYFFIILFLLIFYHLNAILRLQQIIINHHLINSFTLH